MKRPDLVIPAVVAAVCAVVLTPVLIAAQSEGQPCEATRIGDVVTIDLSTCEVTPSTSPTSSPSSSAPSTSTPTTLPSSSSSAPSTTLDEPPTTSSPPSTAAPTTEPAPTTEATPPVPTAAPTTSAPAATTSTTSAPATSTTAPAATTTLPPSGAAFVEDFATPASLDRFDWQISHGGVDPFPRTDQPRTWHADHDMSCSAPPTLREVNLARAAGPGPASVTGGGAFWCAPGNDAAKGHVMTSTALTAYGHIDFAPKQTFTNVRRVCWDMNRSDLGGRKWWQVSIIPEAGFQANGGRLDYVKPNLETDVAAGGPVLPAGSFQMETFRSAVLFTRGDGLRSGADPNEMSLDAFGTVPSDRATRYRHCLVDGAQGVTLTITRGSSSYVTNLGSTFRFPTGPVRVIFQDVTYDSLKGDFHMGGDPDTTNTWHVDQIVIE